MNRIVTFLSLALSLLTSAVTVAADAGDIHKATQIKAGLAVHIGPHTESGDVAYSLWKSGDYFVHRLVESGQVEDERRRLRKLDAVGPIIVEGLGKRLPFPDRFVDLLIADLDGVKGTGLTEAELQRVLAVDGEAWIRTEGKWKTVGKDHRGPIDDWTHSWYDPTGNPVSRDEIAGIPTSIQWAQGPSFADGSISGKIPRIANGSFFAIDNVDGSLFSRSAGNGLSRWRFAGKLQPTTDLAVVGGQVVLHGDESGIVQGRNANEAGPLVALDARTGKPVRVYDKGLMIDPKPGQKPPGFPQFLVADRLIVQAVGPQITLLDRADGKRRWSRKLDKGVWFSPILLGDLVLAIECAEPPRRNRLTNSNEAVAVTAMNLNDGKVKWRTTEVLPPAVEVVDKKGEKTSQRPGLAPLVGADGLILLHGGSYQTRAPNAFIAALSATDGKQLWRHIIPEREWNNTIEASRVVKRGDFVYYMGGRGVRVYEAKSGKPTTDFLKRPRYAFNGFGECSGSRATTHWLLANGLCFWDENLKLTETWGARSSCGTGLIPANGMLYALPTGCDCRSYSRGYLGLNCSPLPPTVPDEARLVKGPAYGKQQKKENAASGWTTFLGNPQRSGATSHKLPEKLDPLWSVRIATPLVGGSLMEDRRRDERFIGFLTGATVGGGLVLGASPEHHEVTAVETATGKIRWRYSTPGMVDSPPTIADGLALFGCYDGRVYALRLDDGELVWSFLAAPVEQKALLHGQLTSAFPVHGSVVVLGGRLLATAGFHTDLGGVHAWSLDPATGKVLGKGVLRGGTEGQAPATNDLLAADLKGEQAWLFQDAALTTEAQPVKMPWKRSVRDSSGPVVALDRGGAFVRYPHDRRGGSTHGWKGAMRADSIAGHRVVRDGEICYTLMDPTESDRHPVRADQTKLLRAMSGTWPDVKELWMTSVKHLGSKESYSALLKAGDRLYLGGGKRDGREGFVQIVDAKTGKLLAERQLSARVTECGLAAGDEALYVSCEDGTLLCFGRKP